MCEWLQGLCFHELLLYLITIKYCLMRLEKIAHKKLLFFGLITSLDT